MKTKGRLDNRPMLTSGSFPFLYIRIVPDSEADALAHDKTCSDADDSSHWKGLLSAVVKDP